METTIPEIKKFKNPFFWFAANGEVLAAENGIPMDFTEYNWIQIWLKNMMDNGYDINEWKLYCGNNTLEVTVEKNEIFISTSERTPRR